MEKRGQELKGIELIGADSPCIAQYVELRNQNKGALLTKEVGLDETLLWIEKTSPIIYGLIEEGELKGVCVVYTIKNGEITIFVKTARKGYGTELLEHCVRKNKRAWAWIQEDNIASIRLFEKCGFKKSGEEIKIFEDKTYKGYIYELLAHS